MVVSLLEIVLLLGALMLVWWCLRQDALWPKLLLFGGVPLLLLVAAGMAFTDRRVETTAPVAEQEIIHTVEWNPALRPVERSALSETHQPSFDPPESVAIWTVLVAVVLLVGGCWLVWWCLRQNALWPKLLLFCGVPLLLLFVGTFFWSIETPATVVEQEMGVNAYAYSSAVMPETHQPSFEPAESVARVPLPIPVSALSSEVGSPKPGKPTVETAGDHTCPMHPQIRQPSPGRCPICAMELVAAADGGAGPSPETAPLRIGSTLISKTETPEWTTHPVTEQGDSTLLVASSGRYTSEDEADRVALQEAAARVTRFLLEQHPEMSGWQASADQVENYILKRAVETQIRDFGSIQAPMYRVHLQVKLSPELTNNLQDKWRQGAVNGRLSVLLGGVGVLTVLFGAASVALRGRPKPTAVDEIELA